MRKIYNYYYPQQQQQQPTQQSLNQMYGNMGYMQPVNQVQVPSLKGRPVSSIEEARAAQVDFDGSLFLFPDIANKKIYTKQINLDGTANLNCYALQENKSPQQTYVTKEEFDAAVALLNSKLEEKSQSKDSAIIF